MSERTALEIADKLDYWTRSVMSIHNVPTLPKLCDCGEKAADMLRQQHAEIDRLKRERHHIYDLLARIHRDGGQYTAEHGVEKACDDAEAQVVAWLETINGIDALIEQARIAEREACAAVCEAISTGLSAYRDGYGASACLEAIRARSANWATPTSCPPKSIAAASVGTSRSAYRASMSAASPVRSVSRVATPIRIRPPIEINTDTIEVKRIQS